MFANNLKRLRKNKRLSQEQLAQYLGITRQGYSKYENDNSEPSFEMLIKIADLFSVSTDELLGRVVTLENTSELEKDTLFSYDQLGISQNDFESLTAYQQEVIEWAASEGGPIFKNKSSDILDMMERLEIAYEVDKVMKQREKNKKSK